MQTSRRFFLLVLAPVALLAPVGAARQPADPVAAAAEALRSDPVYVDPSAERALTGGEADDLRERIRSSDTAIFVAVLPAAAGDAGDVAGQLVEATELSGTYAVVVGNGFRATSTELPQADEIATAAFQATSSDGTAAVLSRFVDDVAEAARTSGGAGGGAGAGTSDGGGGGAAEDDDGGPPYLLIGLLGAGAVGGGLWWRSRRRKAEERRAQRAAEVEMLRAELAVLADDVLRLEPEVELHPEARDDYEGAVERHRVVSTALDQAAGRVDPMRIRRVLDEARYAMARAKARVEGREPPPPPDDLRRPGPHAEPPLDLDDQGAPVYAGGRPFYGGGWYGGGGGGLFEGLLLGSFLGGGWGWGGPVVIHDSGDDGGDGGDWGGDAGGDWGGDVGGGDWGGGDFGGGDFGGGDW